MFCFVEIKLARRRARLKLPAESGIKFINVVFRPVPEKVGL